MSELKPPFDPAFSDLIERVSDIRIISHNMGNPLPGEFVPTQLKRVLEEGKDLIAEEYGSRTTGYEVLDASEHQMRLAGMSSSRAETNARALAKIVFVAHDDREPALFVGDRSRGGVYPRVIMFGTELSRAPILMVRNQTKSDTPTLATDFSSPSHGSPKDAFRFYAENAPWRIGCYSQGPSFDGLLVTEDAGQLEGLGRDKTIKNIILVGKEAVVAALPQLAGTFGPKDSIEIVRRLVTKYSNDTIKVGDAPIEHAVAELLTIYNKTSERYLFPVHIHGKVFEDFDPANFRRELFYAILEENSVLAERIGNRIWIALKEKDKHDDSRPAMVGVVRSVFQDILRGIGYRQEDEFFNSISPKQYDTFISEVLKRKIDITKRGVFMKRKMIAALRELED